MLKEYLVNTNILHELHCNNNDISDRAVIHLSNVLGMNHSLTTVNLSNNAHVLSNLEILAKDLRKNKTLLEFICLDDSSKLGSYSWVKNEFDLTPGTVQMKPHKTQLKNKKIALENEIDQKRGDARNFIIALTAGPQKTRNNTLIHCDLHHAELFSPKLDSKAKKKGESDSEISTFVSRNQARARECYVTFENILRTGDENEIDKFTNFLDEGVSVYYMHSQNQTFLHLAVIAGHPRLVSIILNKMSNFDIDILDKESNSPLSLAKDNEELVKLLRDPKMAGMPNDSAAVQPANKKAKTILAKNMAAAALTQAEEDTLLPDTSPGASPLAKKAKAGADYAEDIESPIMIDDWMVIQAIHSENIMGLKFFINQNPGLLSSHVNGETLLHIAVDCKKPRVVAMLVSSGANVNAINQHKRPVLFCLLDQCVKSRQCNIDFLLIAKTLLENGAKIMDHDEYALQLAVHANASRLVKLLMRFDGDVNQKDIHNHTALTVAVMLRNFEILEILLLCPDLEKQTVQHAISYAEPKQQQSPQALMSMLVTRGESPFLNKKLNIHWLKSMRVCFGATSAHNKLFIESHEQQMNLMMQNKFSSSILKSRKKTKSVEDELEKEEEGNPVTVSFTFIISTQKHLSRSHNTRDCITITLDPSVNLNAMHHITHAPDNTSLSCESIRQTVAARVKRGEALSKRNIGERRHKPAEEILDENKLAKRSFEALFHHGEQSLASALEHKQVLDYVIRQLSAHAKFTHGCKFYGVILDIHSPRYVCSNCEIGILSIQDPNSSLFLKNLTEALKCMGCAIPVLSPLRMVTRVGSYQEFERATVTPEEQLDICLDLRMLGNKIILQQDLVVSANPTMQFNSRVNE